MTYRLIGALDYDGQGKSGFLLPVIQLDDQEGLFIQVEETKGRYTLKALDVTGEELTHINIEFEHDLSCTLIVAFRDTSGLVIADALGNLESVLRDFIRSNPDEVAIHLQVAELSGSRDDRRVARARMTELIRQESGAGAAQSFRDISLGLAVFWELLILNAKNAGLGGLLQHRARVAAEFSVTRPLLLSDSTWVVIQPFLLMTPAELVKLFKLEVMVPSADDPPPSSEEGVADDINRRVSAAISEINGRFNAAERISFLFRAVVQHPEAGIALLEQYRDGDEFVTYVAQVLRARLDREHHFGGSVEGVVASMVDMVCAMGRSRGDDATLLRLAESLSEYPVVNHALTAYASRLRKRKVWWPNLLKLLGYPELELGSKD